MKTPRIALLALALPVLLASSAKAGPNPAAPAAPTAANLPKWTEVDENFREWPTIYFTVGKDNRELRCRFSECNPEKNKGRSNLYVLIESGGRIPIDATVFEYHELGAWDPRRLAGQKFTKTPSVVKAHRQKYSSQLSNFKLDNTDGKLFVVQGTLKFAATTDIRTVYMSETGGVVSVAPPSKKAGDVVKPDGTVPPVNPGRRRPGSDKVSWCDPKTGEIHTIPASQKPGAGWRHMGTAPGSSCKADGAVPEITAPVKISEKEVQWLTKRQAAELAKEMADWDKSEVAAAARTAALKDIVGRYRKEIVKNLLPSPNSASYATAAADPKATTASIDATLPAEVWGGKNNSIVGPFGDRHDIQLSKEEWTVLTSSKSHAEALKSYKADRRGADGIGVNSGTYNAADYDPIQLHLVTMAARAAVGTVATNPGTNPGGEPADAKPLTADEMKLLTPKERLTYEKLLQNAKEKVPGADKALALESQRLRGLIAAEKRKDDPPYKAPANEAAFNDPKYPKWHKDTFCDPKIAGAAAAAVDSGTPGLDNDRNARRGLDNSAAAADASENGTATTAATGGLPDWAKGPCAMYIAGKTPVPGGGGGRRKQDNGADNDLASKNKEVESTVANSLFMRTQIQTFVRGSLIGLVIGSLFGPIGLIAGPLLFGGLMYGMQKYDAVKADEKEKKEKSAGE